MQEPRTTPSHKASEVDLPSWFPKGDLYGGVARSGQLHGTHQLLEMTSKYFSLPLFLSFPQGKLPFELHRREERAAVPQHVDQDGNLRSRFGFRRFRVGG